MPRYTVIVELVLEAETESHAIVAAHDMIKANLGGELVDYGIDVEYWD